MTCQLASIVLSDDDTEGQRMGPLGKAAILIDTAAEQVFA